MLPASATLAIAFNLLFSPVPPSEHGSGDRLLAPTAASHFKAAAEYSAKFSGRAVLVMVDGEVIFEQYDNNWSAERPHPLASGTKSFTGVLAACALADGLLLSWDEVASDTISEWAKDPKKSKITVRQLLSLSSGLQPGDPELGTAGGGRVLGPGIGSRKDTERGSKESRDKAAAALALPMKHDPGSTFEYGPSHYYAFGELLRRKLIDANAKDPAKFPDTDVLSYMHRKIFDPIGLKVAWFGKDPAGNPNLPGGCLLTAREWAKFGRLVLQNGTWTGKDGKPVSLVPQSALGECFKSSPTNPAYGLTWWLLSGENGSSKAADGEGLADRIRRKAFEAEVGDTVLGPDGKPLTVLMAAGKGKQRLYVIPQYQAVIVRFAEDNPEGRGFSNGEFLGTILDLPSGKRPK